MTSKLTEKATLIDMSPIYTMQWIWSPKNVSHMLLVEHTRA